MKRRILVNILLAFVLLPILKNAPMFLEVVILGNEMPYHLAMDYWSYMELYMIENLLIYPILYMFTILVPYNLILSIIQCLQNFYTEVYGGKYL
ncbi:hypothetical protein [Algoriphagus chordae]|uniref:Uncharacterized protein n=1 Tax=Algoriphagus chordae TaxID=237019 RepID=A0A2W7QFB0_9BACT|nr:hypothetical protein [Algoriphagus chordae]PZX46871.1 hypothetical protein LV85_04205 [Algoriphagus chordae]